MMAAFDKVADGVRAAADIQRNLATYNALAPETLRARIGIHAGEPVASNERFDGETRTDFLATA
jgi:class 3 adenylate cyclase